MLNEFMQEWSKWLVLKDEIDQTKQPGLLKSNLSHFLFFFISMFDKKSISLISIFKLNGKLETVLSVHSVPKCIKLLTVRMRN